MHLSMLRLSNDKAGDFYAIQNHALCATKDNILVKDTGKIARRFVNQMKVINPPRK